MEKTRKTDNMMPTPLDPLLNIRILIVYLNMNAKNLSVIQQ